MTRPAPPPDAARAVRAAEPLTLTFTVPGVPVPAVRMTQGTKWGARAQRYLAYKDAVGWAAKGAGATPFAGEVHVSVAVYQRRRRGDLDNFIKSAMDGMNGVCYGDDRQVTAVSGTVCIDPENEECMTVRVWERWPVAEGSTT